MSRVTGWTGAAFDRWLTTEDRARGWDDDDDPMDDYDPMVSGLAGDSHWGEAMTGAEGFTRDRPLVAT